MPIKGSVLAPLVHMYRPAKMPVTVGTFIPWPIVVGKP